MASEPLMQWIRGLWVPSGIVRRRVNGHRIGLQLFCEKPAEEGEFVVKTDIPVKERFQIASDLEFDLPDLANVKLEMLFENWRYLSREQFYRPDIAIVQYAFPDVRRNIQDAEKEAVID